MDYFYDSTSESEFEISPSSSSESEKGEDYDVVPEMLYENMIKIKNFEDTIENYSETQFQDNFRLSRETANRLIGK